MYRSYLQTTYPAQIFFLPLAGQGKKEASFKERIPGDGGTTSQGGLTQVAHGMKESQVQLERETMGQMCSSCGGKGPQGEDFSSAPSQKVLGMHLGPLKSHCIST